MKEFEKIPKVAYFYWGGTPMPLLNALTVFSFKRHHPEWRMIMYRPVMQHEGSNPFIFSRPYDGHDYGDLVYVMMDEVREWDLREIGLYNELHNVQKADLLRHYVLWKEGGFWVDMDILFVRRVDSVGIPEDIELGLSYSQWFSSGAVLSSPNNPVYHLIHTESLSHLDEGAYQSVGPELLNRLFHSFDRLQSLFPSLKMFNMPMCMFYPYAWDEIEPFYSNEGFRYLTEQTVGVHWYGGNVRSKEIVQQFHPENFDRFRGTVVGELAKSYLGKE